MLLSISDTLRCRPPTEHALRPLANHAGPLSVTSLPPRPPPLGRPRRPTPFYHRGAPRSLLEGFRVRRLLLGRKHGSSDVLARKRIDDGCFLASSVLRRR